MSDTDQVRTSAGIPVQGDITNGATRYEQRPKEEFEPLIRALLEDDAIKSFGWSQHTPYFNDGEPCEFGASALWVRTVWEDEPGEDADDDDFDPYDLEVSSRHPSLGDEVWSDQACKYVKRENEHFDQGRLDRCSYLSDAIEGGHFDDVLIDLFGDHARINVTRAGIQIQFYDHE